MRIRGIRTALAVIVAGMTLAFHGMLQAEPVDKALQDKLRKALEQPERGLAIGTIEASTVPGIYAVQFVAGPVVYATADGKYFFLGDLHQVTGDGFVNITEQRRDVQRKELLAAVDPKDMIVFSPKGEPRATISVFTDVTCFYCQKLHLEVPELTKNGVEVRYLAYPRAGVGSDGYSMLATAWCSDDPQDTLTRLKAKQSVPEKDCDDNPIAEQFQLGQTLGVRGTPAIVTEDGRLIPGYQAADELMANIGLK